MLAVRHSERLRPRLSLPCRMGLEFDAFFDDILAGL